MQHVYPVGELGMLVHNACEEVLNLAPGQTAIGFMTNQGRLLGKLTTSTQGGHEALALIIQNAKSLAQSGQAFGFTVGKTSSGSLSVFGSGMFPHVSGTIPNHLKNLILQMVN